MINARDKEQSYKTVPEGTYYYGPTFIVGDVHQLLFWGDLWEVKGTDREVKMTFKLYDITIKGSGLLQLIRDAKRHRIEFLAVTPRHQTMLGGEGMVVSDIVIKAAE
jgi:hypothetical protein